MSLDSPMGCIAIESALDEGWNVRVLPRAGGPGPFAAYWTQGTPEDPRYRLLLELPGHLPELPQKRRHWIHHKRAADNWRALVLAIVRPEMRPPEPLSRASIVCTRRSSVEPDFENLAASFKPVVDALCTSRRHGTRFVHRAEIIEDDKPSVLSRDYAWELASPNEGGIRLALDQLL